MVPRGLTTIVKVCMEVDGMNVVKEDLEKLLDNLLLLLGEVTRNGDSVVSVPGILSYPMGTGVTDGWIVSADRTLTSNTTRMEDSGIVIGGSETGLYRGGGEWIPVVAAASVV